MNVPWLSLLGGALIGLSASVLLLFDGRVAGISGIFSGLLKPVRGEVAWRAAFLGAFLITGVLMAQLTPAQFGASPRSLLGVALAGVLVGVGSKLANGCTSGHGVCGLSRFSKRSIAATITFMFTAGITVFLMRTLAGHV